MTAMLTTMIPCSAKTPIIALVMGVLAGGSTMWWVAPMFYFMGLAAIIISAIITGFLDFWSNFSGNYGFIVTAKAMNQKNFGDEDENEAEAE